MSDLHSQIHDYVEATIERVDVEDVVAAASAGRTTDPAPIFRRRPVWVAVGAALLVVLLIGVPLVLFRGGDSTTVDQPTTTTVSVTSTIVSTTQPRPETISTTRNSGFFARCPTRRCRSGFHRHDHDVHHREGPPRVAVGAVEGNPRHRAHGERVTGWVGCLGRLACRDRLRR